MTTQDDIEEAKQGVYQAGSLQGIIDTLVNLSMCIRDFNGDNTANRVYILDEIDIMELPTFGGEEPDNLASYNLDDGEEVWSFDEDSLLVGSHPRNINIIPRTKSRG